MGKEILGKGDLLANISRSYLEVTNKQKIKNAIWWENLGTFQINYWLNIDLNPELGLSFDGSNECYEINSLSLNLTELKQFMQAWLDKNKP